jgi:hypothetical protein
MGFIDHSLCNQNKSSADPFFHDCIGLIPFWLDDGSVMNYWSQSQSYFTTDGLPPIYSSWRQAPWDSWPVFFFQLNTCDHSPYVTPSLTRGWDCRLQLLLVLARAIILRSESRGIHDHILLSQIRDSSNLEGQVPIFISPRDRVAQLYLKVLGSVFIASYDSQGYGGGIRPSLRVRSISVPGQTP